MSTLFYHNRYLLGVTLLVLIVAGATAFLTLPRLEDPRITNRNPIILTQVAGASAERVQTLVTERLEEALQEVSEIKTLEATSRAGLSSISVELKDAITAQTNDAVFSKIRDRLSDAEADLPAEAAKPFLDDQRLPVAFTLIAAVRWPGEAPPNLAILSRLSEELADRLRSIPGTELVRRYGAATEEIVVETDPAVLADLGLEAADVAARLKAADAKVPAGQLRHGDRDVVIEVDGGFEASARIARVPVAETGTGATVRLQDVARVQRAVRTPQAATGWANGDRAVFVAARMETGIRVDQWAPKAQAAVAAMQPDVGDGVTLDIVFDQAQYTNARLASLGINLFLGAVVVVAVVMATMGWRSGLMVGLAIPLTACAVLFAISLTGGALHQMSIFGMIIALGLLIDNAIVVVDEVTHRLRQGVARDAALSGALKQLFTPLLASTLTTMLAFAPITLLPGNAGDFVGWIGGSVMLAIGFSFAIAMTVIATLAAHLVTPSASQGWWQRGLDLPRFARFFAGRLRAALIRPRLGMLAAAAPALVGFAIAPQLGNQFFPPVDRNMFEIDVRLPQETALARTEKIVAAMEADMRQAPALRHVYWMVGNSFPSVYYNLVMDEDRASHYAHGIVVTERSDDVDRLIKRFQRRLDRRFPEAQVIIRQFGQGPPVSADVQFRLFGPDRDELQDLGDRMRRTLQAHGDVLHTSMTMARGLPKLWVAADEDETRLAGLSLRQLAGQLQGTLEGYTGGSLLEGLEDLPVRVRAGQDIRGDLSAIGSLPLSTEPAARAWVPLASLGAVELRPEPASLTRYNGRQTNIVEGWTQNDALPIDATYDVLDTLAAQGFEIPPGYRLGLGGAVEEDSQAVGNLLQFVPVLVVLTIAIVVLSFRSLRLAGILFAVAGLSGGLAMLSTFAIQFPISFNTILGTLGLIGIALNDSIVVLASIRADETGRSGDIDGVVRAVMGCGRHVCSTTLTTMGGFLPLLIFVGGDFWPSLAIVLVGGIAGATLLATIFVPAAYVLSRRPGDRTPPPYQETVA